MDWQSLPVTGECLTVIAAAGDHRTGSSQIKVKNIVDSAWAPTYHWGNLVTTHHSGQYFAYALTGWYFVFNTLFDYKYYLFLL